MTRNSLHAAAEASAELNRLQKDTKSWQATAEARAELVSLQFRYKLGSNRRCAKKIDGLEKPKQGLADERHSKKQQGPPPGEADGHFGSAAQCDCLQAAEGTHRVMERAIKKGCAMSSSRYLVSDKHAPSCF